jgi:Mg-chelatase subunit ChlD
VIILDKSGSMRDEARRVSNEIIPLFLSKLGYTPDDQVTLILFDTECEMYTLPIQNVRSLPVMAYGGTEMAPAVWNCQRVFELSDDSKPVRLLTISDGQVQDQVETEMAAARFVEFLKTKNFTINSQAVRLFTSSSQPDTTALCSLLLLNNLTTSQLTDI